MKNVLSRRVCPTNSQEERRSLFPFVVSLRRLRVATEFSVGIALALLILSLPTATAQPNTHRHPDQDFNTLSAAGNDNLKGIWANDKTMWVADNSDSKLYAYDLTSKQRDIAQDFTLAAENANPSGIWSDGATMWVSDWDDDKLYAYKMAGENRGNRDTSKEFVLASGNADPTGIWSDGTTIWIADSVDGKLYAYKMSDKSRDATKDFNPQTLSADGNDFPQGIWSDGTTIWVADFQGREDHEQNKIYAYNLKTKSRDAAKDFNTLNAAGNDKARGIWSDGATMWVADQTDGKIYAYRSFAFRNPAQDFDTLKDAGNNAPRSLWSDDQTIWVADSADKKLYAYNLATKSRDSDKDFDTLKTAGNANPTGIWSDGTTMWVADWDDDKLYAYNIATKQRDSDKDFDTLKTAGNANPTGIWSNGTTMWVADTADRIYAYKMSDKSRDSGKDLDTNSLIGNRHIQGIWSDGTTIWAANWTIANKIYAFNLSGKTRDAAKDFDTLNAAGNTEPRGLWSDGTTMWVTDGKDDKIYAYRLSDAAALYALNLTGHIPSNTEHSNFPISLKISLKDPPFDGGTARYTASVPYASTRLTVSPTSLQPNNTVSISPADVDLTTANKHEIALAVGNNPITITVTNALANSRPRTRTYTVDVKREFFTFNNPSKNIALTSTSPMLRDIWINDTTMWVVDSGTTFTDEDGKEYRKILAYNWTTKQPNTNKNFNLVPENDAPRGLWSDTVTMWVADANGTVYAYKMSDKTRDTSKRLDLASANGDPRGIWSNGKTMWVADSEDAKLYAYKMSNDPDPDKDLDADLLRNSGNTKPDGLWSDGETMWVANNDANNAKIYAYKLTGECRESGMDFDTLSAVENNQPGGLWSNGTTMWVLDSDDKKLYAYNQPLSGNASLKSLSLNHVYIQTNLFSEVFSKDAPHYTDSEVRYDGAYVIYTTASTTVTAIASDSNAGLVIQPTDADLNTAGHQVNLANGNNKITITVTAENGNVKQYTVNVALESGGRTPVKDFDLAMFNTQPRALWSNGTSWWVADANGTNYVYSSNSVTPYPLSGDNADPQGLWSDNEEEIWVTDKEDRKIYVYDLSTMTNLIRRVNIPTPTGLRDTQSQPRGLWSDNATNNATLWVANSASKKIHAYNTDLDVTKPANDITLISTNSNPMEIWSNESTMWVADAVNTSKIFAYNMWTSNAAGETVWDGSPDSGKNIDISSIDIQSDVKERAIWSDGTTMWVAYGRKLYAFNLPQPGASTQSDDSEDSTLKDLKLSGAALTPAFSPGNLYYTALVDHDVASTSVTATPNDSRATVDILWSSNIAATVHTASRGPQVALQEGYNIIAVDVTAEDGSIQTYLVFVTKSEAPPPSGGPLPQSFRPWAIGGNPSALASSSSGVGWPSRLISADTLQSGGIRFVFIIPESEEFGLETSSNLLLGEWRPLPDEEFQLIRKTNGDGQSHLTIILPKAAGKQRFLRLTPRR